MAMLLPTLLILPATPGTRGCGTRVGGSLDLSRGGRVSCCRAARMVRCVLWADAAAALLGPCEAGPGG